MTADGTLTEERSIIVQNGTDVGSVQGMAVWSESDCEILFSDSKHGCIKKLKLASGQKEEFVGETREAGLLEERDGCRGLFAQPTGILVEHKTLYVIDSAARKLKVIVSPKGLINYLTYLDKFCALFGIHKRNTKPVILKIEEVIKGLKEVYHFDKQCVHDVKTFYNMKDEELTQGPQGTVSTVVIKDEERIIMGLKNLHQAFADICPSLIEKFDVRSILTLCVENVFSEIRSGGLDMPLQLDFDRKFPKAVRERLKRQCQYSFNYFTHVDTYYPKITSFVSFKSLPKPPRCKTVHLSEEKIETMRNWRAEHGQKCSSKNS